MPAPQPSETADAMGGQNDEITNRSPTESLESSCDEVPIGGDPQWLEPSGTTSANMGASGIAASATTAHEVTIARRASIEVHRSIPTATAEATANPKITGRNCPDR